MLILAVVSIIFFASFTQIAAHLERLGRPLPMWHTVEVLDRAYGQGVTHNQ